MVRILPTFGTMIMGKSLWLIWLSPCSLLHVCPFSSYSINSFASKFVNANGEEEDDDTLANVSFTLTFNIEFDYDNDTVYFAHSYPYTYSDLQDYLMAIQRHPIKSKFCKLRLLCRSLAGNNVYYLTVTAPSAPEDENQKVGL